ncbi:MAG: hypothetical protein GWO10_06650 [candidate division Zixibacteria bacterium]|nr:hypothetical protein [candidate division Zixibacteria bacterium]NIW44397.1 hypothetical protein [Gammaproteobacteria bacterium]
MTLHTYLPQDRLRAIANNTTLPNRTSGSALFADISGFTPLTVSFHKVYGVRRGSEELSKHLETVYSALITEIEKFGGSVIFERSIGRTDLPGGSYDQLMESIRTQVLSLPDETRLLTGHGPETTVGKERKNNPFLSEKGYI